MFKCLNCGHIFEKGEETHWHDVPVEFWGNVCAEDAAGCPICKGEYEETTQCIVCGSQHFESELIDSICKNCIDKYRDDFKMCYNISRSEKEEVKIKSIFAELFTPTEIEIILLEYVMTNCPNIDCSKFIDSDIYWFAEKLEEEIKNNEKNKN